MYTRGQVSFPWYQMMWIERVFPPSHFHQSHHHHEGPDFSCLPAIIYVVSLSCIVPYPPSYLASPPHSQPHTILLPRLGANFMPIHRPIPPPSTTNQATITPPLTCFTRNRILAFPFYPRTRPLASCASSQSQSACKENKHSIHVIYPYTYIFTLLRFFLLDLTIRSLPVFS